GVMYVVCLECVSNLRPMAKGAHGGGKPVVVTERPPVPPPRQLEPAAPAAPTKVAAPSAPRSPEEIINDIQRELAHRGYYDGVIDGLYGPQTDAAIRDFEQAAGLKPSTEPNEALLQAIMRSAAKLAKGATGATAAVRPTPVRSDSVIERPAASTRVIALQP